MQELFNVTLIRKTFPVGQRLSQGYVWFGKTDGNRPHERSVQGGSDPTGLIRLIGDIAEVDVGVADRIQRHELLFLIFSWPRFLHRASFPLGSLFERR